MTRNGRRKKPIDARTLYDILTTRQRGENMAWPVGVYMCIR
jgi:hypothetical protein